MSNNKKILSCLLLAGAAFSTSAQLRAQDHDHDHGKAGHAPKQEFAGDPYMLGTDPVSGEKLGPIAKQVTLLHEGRELRFESEQTANTFRSDPAKFLAQIDGALVRQQLPFYPLETCPISGEKLGGMGEPINFIFKNRLVRFCCKGCKPKFLQAPGKFVAALDKAAIAAQGPNYSLKTCLVSGEELGGDMGEPIDYVIGNRLVRLCCKGCKKKVSKNPMKYLAQLDGDAPTESGHDSHDHVGHGGHGGDHGERH